MKRKDEWINTTWKHKVTGDTVRVMGVVEGYIVYRRPRAMPSLRLKKDFCAMYQKAVAQW